MSNSSDPRFKDSLLRHASAELAGVPSRHRQELDRKLRFALDHERRSRRVLLFTVAVSVAMSLLALLLQAFRPVAMPEPLLLLFVTALLLAPVAALIFAALHFFKYRPLRKRVESEVDRSALEELRHEIDELKRRLEQREGGSR